MARLNLEFVLKLIIGVAVVLLLLLIIFGVINPSRAWFSNLLFENKTVNNLQVSEDLPFYNEFVKNYQECKLSPSTECYCPITYPKTPDKYVIGIINEPSSKSTTISVSGNVVVSENCDATIVIPESKESKNVQLQIENDITYFKDYKFFLGFGGPKVLFPSGTEIPSSPAERDQGVLQIMFSQLDLIVRTLL